MKALKILGGIVLTIVLAACIFYVGWLKAPAPEEVCDNVAAVTKKETGHDFGAKDREACIQSVQPPEYGRIPYARQMKCLRDAKTSAELDACTK